MTWNCKEFHESRDFTDANGVLTGTRVFHVWSDDETLDTPLLVQDKFGSTPDVGDDLPGYFSYFLDDGRIVAVSPTIRVVDSSSQLWRVTWEYRPFSTNGVQKQPNEPGFVEYSANGRAEFRSKWRSEMSIPVNSAGVWGQTDPNTIADVGGQPIDFAGEPVSAQHNTQEITVTVTRLGPPPWNILKEARGKRNAGFFAGIAPGFLVFVDYSVARASANIYKASYHFVEDQDAHMIQSPARDPLGKVLLTDEAIQVAGVTVTRAAFVGGIQPFPGLLDFYNIDPYLAGQI